MKNNLGVTIPQELRKLLYVGERNRAGNLIDYKIHPVMINSPIKLEDYGGNMFSHYMDIEDLPLIYTEPKPFIVLRPTATRFKDYVHDRILASDLDVSEVIQINDFIKLAEVLYRLSPKDEFTWLWRAITSALKKSGDDDQATVFLLDNIFFTASEYEARVLDIRARIRDEIGSTPYVFTHQGKPECGIDLHHLHAPDWIHLPREFNALMHAFNKTSIFGEES